MPSSKFTCNFSQAPQSSVVREDTIETALIGKLLSLKYDYRPDITDRATLEQNFREKFESLNRVRLTDGEFARLLEEIITPDVFTAARTRYRWDPTDAMGDDVRFKNYGLAPKSAADFAFLLHGFHFL